MNTAWDVAVVGGGPAGSASAISLRQTFPSLRVLVLESSDYSQPRAGEVLPPIACQLLAHLGVLSQITAQHATPARGLACAWGSHRLRQTSYFFSLAGEGWHFERHRFDALLATHAETLGSAVRRGTALQAADRFDDAWHLHLSDGPSEHAHFVIDATGRSAAFARARGARLQPRDSLVAFSRIFQQDAAVEAKMVVEACAQGWWYTTPLPGHRRVVSLLTDADLGRELHLSSETSWQRELDRTQHIAALTQHASLQPELLIRSAASVALDPIFGDGWLAAGDAATACDPLSAQGITSALRSGILAGFAAGDALTCNDASAPERYARIVQTQRASYLRIHREHYASERRWNSEPFWQRRQLQPTPTSPHDLALHGAL
jgi:flavin-dependent dehydrogenase